MEIIGTPKEIEEFSRKREEIKTVKESEIQDRSQKIARRILNEERERASEAISSEKWKVNINPECYIAKEIIYQTELLHKLDRNMNMMVSEFNSLYTKMLMLNKEMKEIKKEAENCPVK
ncbi:MAG TPA: hypothetical protein DDW34_13885 [Clostridium sp.]|nr:hypothetical protein [Clostridium sp.]